MTTPQKRAEEKAREIVKEYLFEFESHRTCLILELTSELTALYTEIEALKEGLRPFAEVAEFIKKQNLNIDPRICFWVVGDDQAAHELLLNLGNCNCASQLLTPTKEKGTE